MSGFEGPVFAAPAPVERPRARRRRRTARAYQEVTVALRVGTVEEAVAALRAQNPRRRVFTTDGGLGRPWLRVRDDGRVRGGRVSSQFLTYPSFRGRLRTDALGRVELAGEVRESMADLFYLGIWVFVVLLMGALLAAVLVEGLRSGDWGWAPLAVSAPSTVVFSLLVAGSLRGRRRFPLEARELVLLLAELLPR